MKLKTLCILLSVFLMCSGILYAGDRKEMKTVTIKDCFGKDKVIPLPVKRVILLDPSGPALAIKALRSERKIIGVHEIIKNQKKLYPYLSSLPVVVTNTTPDFEKIISLKPDVVVMSYWWSQEVEKKLEPDIKVLRLNVAPPLTYQEEIEKLGILLDREEEATDFINWYQKKTEKITRITQDISEKDKPRVFDFYGGKHGASPPPPFGTYGKKNFWTSPLISMAGGINISGELEGDWITVDPEWVITANPDIIVRAIRSYTNGYDVSGYKAQNSETLKSTWEGVRDLSALESSNAVKNNRVYVIESHLEHSMWFIGLQYLAKWYHPDLFEDLDPKAVHQEFLAKYLRIDFDVSTQGAFTYPK